MTQPCGPAGSTRRGRPEATAPGKQGQVQFLFATPCGRAQGTRLPSTLFRSGRPAGHAARGSLVVTGQQLALLSRRLLWSADCVPRGVGWTCEPPAGALPARGLPPARPAEDAAEGPRTWRSLPGLESDSPGLQTRQLGEVERTCLTWSPASGVKVDARLAGGAPKLTCPHGLTPQPFLL